MKVYEKNEKMIFEDNWIKIEFDYSASCCEQFGYCFTKKPMTDKTDKLEIDPELYSFDVNSVRENNRSTYGYEGNAASFRLTGPKDIYLNLYNDHNGYYSHSYSIYANGKEIGSGSL